MMRNEQAAQRFYETIEHNIRKHGIHVQGVFGSNAEQKPTFTHTIGLTECSLPEVICIGIPMEVAGAVLNTLYAKIKKGWRFKYDTPIRDIANLPGVLKRCGFAKSSQWAVQAYEYYRGTDVEDLVQVAQLVIPDEGGCFPWHNLYDHGHMDPYQKLIYEDA